MNPYLASQILNAQAMARNFNQACQQAVIADDGKVSKEEQKQLKKIRAITDKFINDLDRLG